VAQEAEAIAGSTRGFIKRYRGERDPRLPPGQYDAGRDWPVLNAEVTPKLDMATWTLRLRPLSPCHRPPMSWPLALATRATRPTCRWTTSGNDKAWLAWEVDGQALPVEHGGPARLLVPHLYF
jgi:hypothetical protein